MLNTNGSYRFKADNFFPWLLLFTLISVITLTWWQVDVLKSVESWKLVRSWSTINYLAFGLTLFTFLTVGCIISASLPALVYQKRYGGWFGWRWAIPYAFYWLFCLYWISFWGLLTASRSGWLTRGLPDVVQPSKLPEALPTTGRSRVFSKAA